MYIFKILLTQLLNNLISSLLSKILYSLKYYGCIKHIQIFKNDFMISNFNGIVAFVLLPETAYISNITIDP